MGGGGREGAEVIMSHPALISLFAGSMETLGQNTVRMHRSPLPLLGKGAERAQNVPIMDVALI